MPGILEGVPAAREYEGGFATSLMLKDLRLALDAAAAVGAPTPSAEHARRLYRLSAERGFAYCPANRPIRVTRRPPP